MLQWEVGTVLDHFALKNLASVSDIFQTMTPLCLFGTKIQTWYSHTSNVQAISVWHSDDGFWVLTFTLGQQGERERERLKGRQREGYETSLFVVVTYS